MRPNEQIKLPISLEDNLKKALTELLVLHLLSQRDYYISELTATLKERSGQALNIVFPYGAIYRLQQAGYIEESDKRTAPDGRRRQFYRITEKGHSYHSQLQGIYTHFIQGVELVLSNQD